MKLIEKRHSFEWRHIIQVSRADIVDNAVLDAIIESNRDIVINHNVFRVHCASACFGLGKDDLGAGDDLIRYSRELCDLDTVAIVGAAGNDLTEKYDSIAAFSCGNIVVYYTVKLVGEGGKLVVMRCKEICRA